MRRRELGKLPKNETKTKPVRNRPECSVFE